MQGRRVTWRRRSGSDGWKYDDVTGGGAGSGGGQWRSVWQQQEPATSTG